jgi:hypothetical protein
MNTLLSIFHLLMMLTHNPLLPDMGSVWKQSSAENSIIAVTVHPVIAAPTEKQHYFTTEAIREEDKEFLTPILYSRETILFLLARQHTGWPRRQVHSIKRYLVFCQLKTEG